MTREVPALSECIFFRSDRLAHPAASVCVFSAISTVSDPDSARQTPPGAPPEYVVEGETGWVVPPGDAGALAEALGAALGDPARLARMGEAGRAWYERQRRREEQILREMYARAGRAS